MRRMACLAAITVCLALPAVGANRSGIYFDDISVSNNGSVVFSDDFNTGKITGWSITRPLVEPYRLSTNPVNYCVYMNRMQDTNTGMDYQRREIKSITVGQLEIKALIYLPSNEELWGWGEKWGAMARTRIDLDAGTKDDCFYVAIDGLPGEMGYQVHIVRTPYKSTPSTGSERKAVQYKNTAPVIPPATWVHLCFKLDPKTKTAVVTIDGKQVASEAYDPDLIHSLQSLDLTTWMGDQPTAK